MGRIESDEAILARYDERMTAISSNIKDIKDSIEDIKTGMKDTNASLLKCNDRISWNCSSITNTGTKLKDHLDQHKRDFAIFGLVIAAITVVIDLLLRR